jgi:hypothetical protein
MTTLVALVPGLLGLLEAAGAQCPDKGMSSAHFIYIPVSIVVGLVLGFLIGTRAARAEAAIERRKAEARAAKTPRPPA